jgi:CheY-like chemotaxis protein
VCRRRHVRRRRRRPAALDDRSVDGVVCDRRLSETDGIEFLRAVRDDHGDLPFVLRVDREAEEAVDAALDAGVTDCVRARPETIRYDSLAKRLRDGVASHLADRHLRVERAYHRRCFEDCSDRFLDRLDYERGGVDGVEHGSTDDAVTVTLGSLPGGRDVFEVWHSTETGGMGLGLAIVERVAAEHGWSVDATDGSDGGARFEFRR